MKPVQLASLTFVIAISLALAACTGARAQSPSAVALDSGTAGQPSDICKAISDQEGESYLLLKLGPCGVGTVQLLSYTSTSELNVQFIHVWTGTPPQQLFEVISRLQIQTPSGKFYEFFTEYDKHSTSLAGMLHQQYAVHLRLPAGTVFTVRREFGGVISCPDQGGVWPPSCLTEIHWRLYGGA
jgi:hypothetical protein